MHRSKGVRELGRLVDKARGSRKRGGESGRRRWWEKGVWDIPLTSKVAVLEKKTNTTIGLWEWVSEDTSSWGHLRFWKLSRVENMSPGI